MNTPADDDPTPGLGKAARLGLIDRFRTRQGGASAAPARAAAPAANVPDQFYRFERHPAYERLLVSHSAAERYGVQSPFFRVHEAVAGATTTIGARQYLNFSSYNYLGLNGHPRVNQAAQRAVERYGTSPSASRLVAGERPVQRQLEQALATFLGVDDCIAFVSGHATNVSTIATLLGPRDLVLHDALIHNSVLEGVKLSGAHRRSFPHNDWQWVDALLGQLRGQFERVLIVVEGLYSMDGDGPDLRHFVTLKQRHKAFLMVDDAHALGVLGATGRGSAEHWGINPRDVDIWMGTLSKTLASCGGYIAGSTPLVELLKFNAPGFVYSVGLSPALAAAALEALHILQEEPQRVARLQAVGAEFLQLARARGIDTGLSEGHAITPAIVGSSLKAARLSNALFERGINAQPIIYPAVEEKAARIRFFLCAMHEPQQLLATADALAELI
ncbi:aminotransferase class I/II-fold pyridoxal phosphate-dependent enzyme [Thiomonas delicata]|uniref:8-amino-7-oxononanoate synthase n=1 Tax=Thiomonas delicata TaxID=364030 RepID=A0A238D9K6_THIDL|nr:aminotransferase class I/II-fold pyridoxal phosphate-dependent enzyme [Thiomonas delicata]SBP89996.1 8-amino-7-oxononanoate synthase [Thiomonas delicata]